MDHDLYPIIVDSISDAVFTVDADWRITAFNRAAETLTGLSREQALGRFCRDVFRADICQHDCALLHTLSTGEPLRDVPVSILDGDMSEVPVEVSTAVLRDEDGRVLGGVEILRDRSEVETLRRELDERDGHARLIGTSEPIRAIRRLLPDVARADVPVLIQGPSGTGKEVVARILHARSPRSDGPFVSVNCGALPDTLLESELFGYRKGAFTDAHRDYPGRFRAATGGTLLLDEIGDTSPAFQVKLLRVLQEGEVHPLGAALPVKVDVRVVAATNKDLRELVAAGQFRQDLYYRLRVVELQTPGLRERPEDIPLLVDHLLERITRRRGRAPSGVSSAAMDRLLAHPFPGNVRELENALERAVVLCHGDTIGPEHLPPEIGTSIAPAPASPSSPPPPDDEREVLLAALYANQWSRARTSAALGISRSTLWRRMRAMDLIERPSDG